MILKPSEANIEKAAAAIRAGALVAFPTETVYGLGASAFNEDAVLRIYQLKRRPVFNPLIIHIGGVEQISQVCELTKSPRAAARFERVKKFWPGPLSVILPKSPAVAEAATSGLDTAAVRVPSHPLALALLKACGLPLAAPSANIFSSVSPTTARHVEESFGERAPIILDGGPCQVGLESTIVTLVEEKVRILRPGGVSEEELASAIGPDDFLFRKHSPAPACPAAEKVVAPGMLPQHYAPKTKLLFRESRIAFESKPAIGLIAFSDQSASVGEFDFKAVRSLSQNGDLCEIARNLYAALRDFDRLGLDLILIDSCPESGIGRAIMDRLRRAMSGGNDQLTSN